MFTEGCHHSWVFGWAWCPFRQIVAAL
jgi:hypothetical protein